VPHNNRLERTKPAQALGFAAQPGVLALSAGWVVLAVATRLKLRR